MAKESIEAPISFDDIRQLQSSLHKVDLTPILNSYSELVKRIRNAGIYISDRRAVKLQKLIAASALICGRDTASINDLWIMQYIWDLEEQQEILRALVQEQFKNDNVVLDHPLAAMDQKPDSESLARDLAQIESQLKSDDNEKTYLKDRLAIVAGRCEWVESDDKRQFLQEKVEHLRAQLDH